MSRLPKEPFYRLLAVALVFALYTALAVWTDFELEKAGIPLNMIVDSLMG